jgi:hypothetical protein
VIGVLALDGDQTRCATVDLFGDSKMADAIIERRLRVEKAAEPV